MPTRLIFGFYIIGIAHISKETFVCVMLIAESLRSENLHGKVCKFVCVFIHSYVKAF